VSIIDKQGQGRKRSTAIDGWEAIAVKFIVQYPDPKDKFISCYAEGLRCSI